MPISSSIAEVAARDPERLAITDTERRVSYAALARDGVRAAHLLATEFARLRASGGLVPPPAEAGGVPVVALVVSDAFDLARTICAVMCSPAIVSVIDTSWPLSDRIETIRRGAATLVITDQPAVRTGAAELDPAPEVLALEEWDARLAAGPDADPATAAEPPGEARSPARLPAPLPGDTPFLLLFTSGTTNKPKGFIKSRANWRACFPVSLAHYGAADGQVCYVPGSLAYSLTLYGLIEAIGTGESCIVAPGFEPIDAVRVIREQRVDRVIGVPATLRALAVLERRSPGSLGSLSWAIVGGANLPPSIREEFTAAAPGARLISYFGAAEIGFIGWSESGDGTRLRLFDGVEAQIRDDAGRTLPDGELGTLHLRAEATCVPGYLASTTTVRLRDETGWATVGDQARGFGGEIVLAGRAGDIAVTGGHKVALPEIERAFARIPGSELACAVALPHDTLGSEVVAVIEPGAAAAHDPAPAGTWPPAKAELLDRLRELVAPQFVPRRFYTIDRLPRTVSGKIRRSEVARLLVSDPDRFTRI